MVPLIPAFVGAWTKTIHVRVNLITGSRLLQNCQFLRMFEYTHPKLEVPSVFSIYGD